MKHIEDKYPMNPDYSFLKKHYEYFTGARKSFIDFLPVNNSGRLLEIGCGNGDTSVYALETGKCGWCAGVELCAEPAKIAAQRLQNVCVGDVEVVDLPYEQCYFDVLIMSEVLEHFRDPWGTLIKLAKYLKPGASVISGSPNVAHYSVIFDLLRGRWDYSESGIMDRAHLRWFTPDTYRNIFEECGYKVLKVGPAKTLRIKARLFNRMTLGKFRYLLHSQIFLSAIRI